MESGQYDYFIHQNLLRSYTLITYLKDFHQFLCKALNEFPGSSTKQYNHQHFDYKV